MQRQGKRPAGQKQQAKKNNNTKKQKKANKKQNNKGKKELTGGPSKKNLASGVNKVVKAQIQKEVNAALYSRVANNCEETVDLICPVNPFILCSYLAGILFHPLAISDDPQDFATAYSILCSILSNWVGLPRSWSGTELPRPIVTLWHLLQPKKVGKYRFSPDYTALVTWMANFNTGTNSFVSTIAYCIDITYPGAYGANGFPSAVVSAPLAVTEVMATRFFSKYNSYYDLIGVSEYKVDDNDASAFAFDTNGASEANDVSPSGASMACFAGYQKNAADEATSPVKIYISQSGTIALECRPKNLHFASLRMCTPVAWVSTASQSTNQPEFMASRRSPRFVLPCNTLPSVAGWKTSPACGLRGAVQLKPIPSVASVQAIIDKFEAMVVATGGALQTKWLAMWGANDVKAFCIHIFRYFMRQYSGAYMGTALITKQTRAPASVFFASQPELHGGLSPYNFVRIPEFIGRALGALTPSASKNGTVIPWCTVQATFAGGTALTTSLTYTGSIIATFPAGTQEASMFNFNNAAALVAAYKTIEPYMAAAMNMNLTGQLGDSLLDTTLLVDQAQTGICGLVSRRPIDDNFMYTAMTNLNFLTYDITDAAYSNNSGVSGNVVGSNTYNQEYNQRYRRDTPNFILYNTIQAAFKLEGVVVGALTSNMGNASGTDNQNPPGRSDYASNYSPDLVAAFTKEPPAQTANLARKMMARLIPRSGNYCGPAWTAGVDTFESEVMVGPDGKYIVAPASREDAICKAHDEAYRMALSDEDIRHADLQMVADLEKLRVNEGLSFYGHGAKQAIRAKILVKDLAPKRDRDEL